MKVLHISGATTWRGGEQQLMYLWEELEAKGITQQVFCPKGSALSKRLQQRKADGVLTYRRGMALNPLTAYRLYKVCQRFKPDVMHVHDAHAHTTAYLSAVLWGNTSPLVVSRRVDFPIGSGLLSKRKYNHKNIKAIVCVSEAIKQVMLPDIINKDKLVVVHSGIDTDRFPYNAPTGKLKEKIGIAEGLRIIGNTSALAPHKDYFIFVDTARLILKERNDVHFVIIGTGPLENEIKEYIASEGLSRNFTLMGFRNDVPELLPDFDIFLITSKTEGLGTSVLDAFACHVPVVATNAGGIGEMVVHEQTGLLADVQDAHRLAQHCINLLNNTEMQAKLTEAAALKLSMFTKARTAEKTLNVYRVH